MPIHTKGSATGEGGTLISIGGHEDKLHERLLLRAIADCVDKGALAVATIASDLPDELWTEYRKLFRAIGVRDVRHLHIDTRDQALEADRVAVLDDVSTVFFTGGDQLKLTSKLGDTPIFSRIQEIFESGGCVAGTSAGASVVCETMMVTIGIDEDTAIICRDRSFTVLGSGGVYIVDASSVSHSNLAEDASDRTLSVFDVRLHLLNMGDTFDLETREPMPGSTEDAEHEVTTPKS